MKQTLYANKKTFLTLQRANLASASIIASNCSVLKLGSAELIGSANSSLLHFFLCFGTAKCEDNYKSLANFC